MFCHLHIAPVIELSDLEFPNSVGIEVEPAKVSRATVVATDKCISMWLRAFCDELYPLAGLGREPDVL